MSKADNIRALYLEGKLGYARIAAMLGTSEGYVGKVVRAAGLPSNWEAKRDAYNAGRVNAGVRRKSKPAELRKIPLSRASRLDTFEDMVAYYAKQREELRARAAANYRVNRDSVKVSQRDYYQRNKRKINANPVLRARKSLRLRVYKLVSGYNGKSALLGCDSSAFRDHLRGMFSDGMTWENYGAYWHVDHWIPLAAFHLDRQTHLDVAAHYTNLRPLRVADNRSKGASMPLDIPTTLAERVAPIIAELKWE